MNSKENPKESKEEKSEKKPKYTREELDKILNRQPHRPGFSVEMYGQRLPEDENETEDN